MSESKFIDFQAIKSQVTILQILEHYRLMDRLQQNGDVITGKCPIHENNRHVAFRANLGINYWNCFNQCGCNGDIIDFVQRKERVSAQKAALLIIGWFKLHIQPLKSELESFDPPPRFCEAHPRPMPQPTTVQSIAPGQKMFAVKRCWEMSETVHVPAATIDEAILVAHELPLDFVKAEYVPDSMSSDRETDVHPLPQ